MLPALTPSCGNGGRGRLDWRPALPPVDNKCRTAWLAHRPAVAKARRWQVVKASPPAWSVGGPAIEASFRAALQHQLRQWSLPPPCLSMPACSDVCAECVACMVFTFAYVRYFTYDQATKSPWKLRSSRVGWTACACTYSSRCARTYRDCCCVATVVGLVHGVKPHMPCSQNARALCKSEYAESLIHRMRRLNRRETHIFHYFRVPQFCSEPVSDRARGCVILCFA